MPNKPTVHVLWGGAPEEEATPDTYTFDTEAELNAFLLGIAEAEGWMGYRTGEAINEFRREQGWDQFPDMPDYIEDWNEKEEDD